MLSFKLQSVDGISTVPQAPIPSLLERRGVPLSIWIETYDGTVRSQKELADTLEESWSCYALIGFWVVAGIPLLLFMPLFVFLCYFLSGTVTTCCVACESTARKKKNSKIVLKQWMRFVRNQQKVYRPYGIEIKTLSIGELKFDLVDAGSRPAPDCGHGNGGRDNLVSNHDPFDAVSRLRTEGAVSNEGYHEGYHDRPTASLSSVSLIQSLQSLHELLKSGALTEQEYSKAKTMILAPNQQEPDNSSALPVALPIPVATVHPVEANIETGTIETENLVEMV